MKKKILFGWNGFSNGTVIFYSALAQLQFDCLLIFSYFTNSQEDETAFYSQWKSLGYDLNTYHHQNVSIYHRWHQVTWFLEFFIHHSKSLHYVGFWWSWWTKGTVILYPNTIFLLVSSSSLKSLVFVSY